MRSAPITAAFLAAGLLASGCTTDEGTAVLILHNQAPGIGCATNPSLADPFLARGFIDTNSVFDYQFTPLLKNEALSVDGLADSQRIAFIEGADVDLEFDAAVDDGTVASLDGDGLVSFSVPFTGIVQPDNGLTSLRFPIVPAGVLAELGRTLDAGETTLIQARIRVFGTLGGGDFQTREFRYPIDVCNGCAVVDNGACAALSPDFNPRAGGVCTALQDPAGVVDCCTDGDGSLICPAVSTAE